MNEYSCLNIRFCSNQIKIYLSHVSVERFIRHEKHFIDDPVTFMKKFKGKNGKLFK